MLHYLILAQSEATANALKVWLMLMGGGELQQNDPCRIVWDRPCGQGMQGVNAYESIVHRIETIVNEDGQGIPHDKITVLVDSIKPANLVVNYHGGGWDSLVAMLVLTFPEIRWVFGVTGGFPNFLDKKHSLVSILQSYHHEPLFDATGLRDFVRQKCLLKDDESFRTTEGTTDYDVQSRNEDALPQRPSCAAAIDEESSYARFHAYAAYRFGYRAEVVDSWSLMQHLFNKDEAHGFDLLLEDVCLNFPDNPAGLRLSILETRAKECKTLGYAANKASNTPLENSRFRILITIGDSNVVETTEKQNKTWLQQYKRDRDKSHCGFVSKLEGGIFDLWKKADLFLLLPKKKYSHLRRENKTYGHSVREKETYSHPGLAPGFFWPPPSSNQREENNHSAPGKLMLVAKHLIRRADNMRPTANTVEESVLGAVLATDALELLRYQTPTLALQALCLKHEFEVKAEVAFLGVGHHFELNRRLDELEKEIRAASRNFYRIRRRATQFDVLVSIGNRIMLVFREAGQFDEELICLARIRAWHRKLRLTQARNPIASIMQRIIAYAEWLLISPGRFIVALIVWFLIFFFGYWMINDSWVAATSSAWNAFIATNPAEVQENDFLTLILNATASGVGLFHLGIFISYLYTTVTRR